ncbi:MAG: murein biosynthesis integral membrane protein MurJ [Candidatus Aminicenantes bacterium]|nr:murein biosynthesis integral membrane protein MurJ [Candidatus Aminicenantes bacterium]
MEQRAQNRKLVRSTFAVAAPTLLSRILGFVRDVIQAFYLGTSRSADAFTIAYVIPNLLRRLTGEGAMTAAFVPVFTQLKNEKTKKELWKFANAFFFDLTLIMALVTVLGIVFSPILVKIIAFGFKDIQGKWELTIVLTRIMFPYIFLISLAALAMAILNSFHKFFVPAFTPVLFNLSIITVAVLFARTVKEPAFVFAVGVVIGGALQLAFQIPFLWRKGMRFTPLLSFSHPAIRKVGKLMVPGIFGVGISQINFALSRIIASLLEEGSVSSLYFASRVQELTLGLFSIALSIALLPTFSEFAAQKDVDAMKKTMSFSFKLICLVTFPAMVGLIILNRPIIEVLFQRGVFNVQSTMMSSSCLFYFAFSIPFISGVKIIAPAFYSLKDTKTPVIVAFFVMISYISLSFILMGPLQVGGIALALSLASVINFILLFYLLEKKIGKVQKRAILISAFKSASSAVAMGVAVWIFMKQIDFPHHVFTEKVGFLAAAIAIGICLYVAFQWIFNREEVEEFKSLFSRKKSEHIKG